VVAASQILIKTTAESTQDSAVFLSTPQPQRLLEVHIDHRACIFQGIDELLATGLHLLTS